MRRVLLCFSVASLLVIALSSCGQKAEQQLAESTTDSLLSSSPVEQPAGDISPQTDYQTPPEPANNEPPAPTPSRTPSKPKPSTSRPSTPSEPPAAHGTLVASGTALQIAVNSPLSSETAHVGDAWSGEVKEPVIIGSDVVIPAGSRVEGVVTGALGAAKGDRAALDLAVRAIVIDGKEYSVGADTDSIIAGSTRARNLGAIAGGAAAGALLGKAIGGSGKGAAIGAIIGGAAATGAVAKSKGFQVVIKEGTIITFNVSKDVRVGV
jgi:hypothetical protein